MGNNSNRIVLIGIDKSIYYKSNMEIFSQQSIYKYLYVIG